MTDSKLRGDVMWRGTYRVYFNTKEAAPEVWSIDDGNIENEILVQEVYIYTPCATRFVPSETQPIAWLEGFGTVIVGDGVAIIEDRDMPVVVKEPADRNA